MSAYSPPAQGYYSSQPQVVYSGGYSSAAPMVSSPGLVSTAGVPTPPDLPPGAAYTGSMTRSDGAVIDRYTVPQRQAIPVRSVVPEVQEYQVYGQTTVPETKHIQVQKMVQVQETVMVPRVETRTVMVPEQRTKTVPQMETQAITVPKIMQTVQTMQKTVGKIIEGQKYLDSEQILEYERPRQGRFLGRNQSAARETAVQWTREVGYTEENAKVRAVSQPQMTNRVLGTSPPVQVTSTPAYAAPQYSTPLQQGYAPAPGQYVSAYGSTPPQPSGYYSASPQTRPVTYSSQYQAPQYSTQPGWDQGYQQPQQQQPQWDGYGGEDKEGAF
eukprot:CAMPEP_0173379824 /NCGR_PEP_ID=MMETSP1356-20130122/2635_1 /TAXON_ID=77927 ORGANISM="Hemiselmis virescens, Strain PCC157" /NCGR_SAMPLE_ID=MMETSP1356 /ASSEMBLY_ACC=CAM_ASM_000847 /LENGTH=327 /DNA_ID=CAMNT_0014333233 /DNA_START=19 /DNA_END=1002 /DNA_ORIENTATION=+